MRWLYKLENKFGKYYVPHLMMIIVFGMAAVFLIDTVGAPYGVGLSQYLALTRSALFHGQVWRLITFVFVPPTTGMNQVLWLLISLFFYYSIGTSLENFWGGFRLNVYYLIGMLGAIIACLITGYSTNTYLNLSLFLAFAALAPDTTFMLFFIIPLKAKWLALGYGAFLLLDVILSFIGSPAYGIVSLVALACSLAAFFLFFGRTLINKVKEMIRIRNNRRNWQNRNR